MPLPSSSYSIPSPGDVITVDQLGNLVFKGQIVGNLPTNDTGITGAPSLLWSNAPAPSWQMGPWWSFEDDFLFQSNATTPLIGYTDVKGTGGTNSFLNTNGGWFSLVTAAANDDYRGIRPLAKPWLFQAGKRVWFEARFTLTEAQTNLASWLVGLMDQTTTGGIQAGTAGPLTSFSGAVIYKTQGSLNVNFMTSNSSTQNKSLADAVYTSGVATRVGFFFDGVGTITPYYDVAGTGLVTGTPQAISLASLAQMYLVATVKSGSSGTLAETLSLDYLTVLQER